MNTRCASCLLLIGLCSYTNSMFGMASLVRAQTKMRAQTKKNPQDASNQIQIPNKKPIIQYKGSPQQKNITAATYKSPTIQSTSRLNALYKALYSALNKTKIFLLKKDAKPTQLDNIEMFQMVYDTLENRYNPVAFAKEIDSLIETFESGKFDSVINSTLYGFVRNTTTKKEFGGRKSILDICIIELLRLEELGVHDIGTPSADGSKMEGMSGLAYKNNVSYTLLVNQPRTEKIMSLIRVLVKHEAHINFAKTASTDIAVHLSPEIKSASSVGNIFILRELATCFGAFGNEVNLPSSNSTTDSDAYKNIFTFLTFIKALSRILYTRACPTCSTEQFEQEFNTVAYTAWQRKRPMLSRPVIAPTMHKEN